MVTLEAYNELLAINASLEAKLKEALKVINELQNELQKQLAQVARIPILEAKIVELEARLKKNSNNSHQPPSFDRFRNRSLRGKSGKRPGGQAGHVGKTLEQVENPDNIYKDGVDQCSHCGTSLAEVEAQKIERRQVFDIPKVSIEVSEHQVEIKKCPHCKKINKGKFPMEVKSRVQYGKNILALGGYLSFYQMLPIQRLKEFFQDRYGLPISSATLMKTGKFLYEHLKGFEEKVKEALNSGSKINADETGLKVNKKTEWLHVASTEKLTLYGTHEKRGIQGMEALGVYDDFKGTVIHDGWRSYERLEATHALCNAHHLRELKGIEENYKEKWATKMFSFLQGACQAVEKHREKGLHELPRSCIKA